MEKYFSYFPKIRYSLDDNLKTNDVVTDATFLISLLEPYISSRKYYYTSIIKDGLKPEDVAELVYGDVGLHWLVLHFNKVVNPQFDWPLGVSQMNDYISNKYGSIANSQAQIHSYYRVIKKLLPGASDFYTQKLEITAADYANTVLDTIGTTYVLQDNSQVTVYQDREALAAYDWEIANNEAKREIKLVQKQYVGQIITNLKNVNK